MIQILSILGLVACSDDTLYVMAQDPVAAILEPQEREFEEGEPITFKGKVSDDSPMADLLVEWSSSIDGPIPDEDPPDPEGYVEVTTASLSEGTHVVTLRVTDPDANQGEDTVVIDILDVPDTPSIEILHPTGDEKGLENTPFIFMATVSDRQDPPEDLSATVSSDISGFVCYLTIDGEGNSQCAATLAIGSYLLTFEVVDTDGNKAQAWANFQVVSPLDYDFDGDGYSQNGGDCNDSNATIYPGAPELCDGLDNDCNELTAIDVGTLCYDDDGDGYCELPPCVNTDLTEADCDDTSALISPVDSEVLNGVDDDCDGFVDEGTNAYDDDGDGYCESPPCVNASGTESDCDDEDYDIYPEATEICGDGIDNNCNGTTNEKNAIGCKNFYYDQDGDTYGVPGVTECWCDSGSFPYTGVNSNDCYDYNANANPAQTAYFTAHRGDGSFDYDCSGSEERRYLDISGGCSWADIIYIDCVDDGFGWAGSVPDCGDSALWVDSCEASYDAVCYLLCLMSHDVLTCLLTSCSTACAPGYTSMTQSCR